METEILPGSAAEAPAATGDPEPSSDLAVAPAAAPPRRWWNTTTLVLGGVVLLAFGFVGGIQAQQHWGTRSAVVGGKLPGNGEPEGASAGLDAPGGDRAATIGTVKSISGTTLSVETGDGTTVTVKTDNSTTVRTARTATLSALETGATVTVLGGTAVDGTITATTVTAAE